MKIEHDMVKPGIDFLPEHQFTLQLSWGQMRLLRDACAIAVEQNEEWAEEDRSNARQYLDDQEASQSLHDQLDKAMEEQR